MVKVEGSLIVIFIGCLVVIILFLLFIIVFMFWWLYWCRFFSKVEWRVLEEELMVYFFVFGDIIFINNCLGFRELFLY